MNTAHIKLIEETWQLLHDHEDAFAINMIAKIKKQHIRLLQIVNLDLKHLSDKIVSLMNSCIANLERQRILLSVANQLVDCCEEYNLDMEVVYTVRSILISTLKDALGEQFNSGIQEAWERGFDQLFALMRMTTQSTVL